MQEVVTVCKPMSFRKKWGFASKHVIIEVILALSLDSIKTLKRYTDIFKKLFLIFFYFPL